MITITEEEARITTIRNLIKPLARGLQNGIAFQASVSKLISMANEVIQAQEETTQLLTASQKFVPSHFLRFLNVTDFSKIKLGEYIELELSVLFCDIRNYTSISEKSDKGKLINQINRYFFYMGKAIHEHEGAIDKYIGDSIMAAFKTPADALKAAKKMIRYLDHFNANLESDEQWRHGIGIGHGRVILGTVGDQNRLSTTILGDAVNIASRLESLTKKVTHDILFSDEVVKALNNDGAFQIQKVGRAKLKGIENPFNIYTVL